MARPPKPNGTDDAGRKPDAKGGDGRAKFYVPTDRGYKESAFDDFGHARRKAGVRPHKIVQVNQAKTGAALPDKEPAGRPGSGTSGPDWVDGPTKASGIGPEWTEDAAKQRGTGPEWADDPTKEHKAGPDWAEDAAKEHKAGPEWAEEPAKPRKTGPEWANGPAKPRRDGPEWAEDDAKPRRDGPEWAEDDAKPRRDGPEWADDPAKEHKAGPEWADGAARQRKTGPEWANGPAKPRRDGPEWAEDAAKKQRRAGPEWADDPAKKQRKAGPEWADDPAKKQHEARPEWADDPAKPRTEPAGFSGRAEPVRVPPKDVIHTFVDELVSEFGLRDIDISVKQIDNMKIEFATPAQVLTVTFEAREHPFDRIVFRQTDPKSDRTGKTGPSKRARPQASDFLASITALVGRKTDKPAAVEKDPKRSREWVALVQDHKTHTFAWNGSRLTPGGASGGTSGGIAGGNDRKALTAELFENSSRLNWLIELIDSRQSAIDAPETGEDLSPAGVRRLLAPLLGGLGSALRGKIGSTGGDDIFDTTQELFTPPSKTSPTKGDG